jgi:hypothetical protein
MRAMTPEELLARMRAGVPRLAELIVADALATPAGELMGPVQDFAAAVVSAIAADDGAEAMLVSRLAALIDALPDGPLGDAAPAALLGGARDVSALPFRVPRALMLRVLRREPVRQLLRAQILQTLVEFARKVTAPFTDNAVARGLSRLAFGDRQKPTTLGSIRGALSGEAEKRAADFADTAVDEVIAGIARELADPARAREQAAIRVALMEAVLEETGAELAKVVKPQLAAMVKAARRALGAWGPSAKRDLEAAMVRVVADEAGRSLGDLLAELGLRETVAEHAARMVAERVGAFMEKEPFGEWLRGVMK